MSWLTSDWQSLGEVAAKAVLIFVVALAGLRVGHRRTLAQWTAIDFVAAVALGSIVGRTAIASNQSFAIGAAAVLTILTAHSLMTMGRFSRLFAKLVDHRVRVLVAHGTLRRRQLLICGVTENDLLSKLRERGVANLQDVRYVFYETKGDLTIVHEPPNHEPDSALVMLGLTAASEPLGSPAKGPTPER